MAMPRTEIPVGTRFGKLTVIGEGLPKGKRNERTLECRCDCGNVTSPLLSNLRKTTGTRSCGCDKIAAIQAQQEAGRTHGMRHTRVYAIWHGMKQRCLNPRADEYKWYGARGVTVCEAWQQSFELFYADMGDPPSDDHSIERNDVNGNYEPGNCRWATDLEQMNNMRTNVNIEYDGRTQSIAAWARELGIPRATLQFRYSRGWTTAEVINGRPKKLRTSGRKNGVDIEYDGRTQSIAAWARELGIPEATLRRRHRQGWTAAEIIEGKA